MGFNRTHKKDRNHLEIIKGLKAIGASVQTLSQVGYGCPDLLVGYRGKNLVLEVKDGQITASRQRLSTAAQKWHETWRGQVATVSSLEDALKTITSAGG